MLLKKEKWVAYGRKAVEQISPNKPTGGLAWAIATIRYIRDGIADDIGTKDEDAPFVATVKESCNELIQQVQQKDVDLLGFASNASAAGKAAGLATETFTEFVKD